MVVDITPQYKDSERTRRTALVVEDNPRLHKAMGEQLERMDFRVLSAQNYPAAVAHMTTQTPNIACVDVQLPCKSGYQLCEYIRGVLGLLGLPILMTSDHGSPTDMAYAEDAGANAFLSKPYSMADLRDCVRSLLSVAGWSRPPRHELQRLARVPVAVIGAADRSGVYPSASAA
jgi:DNA-binding response OmpR family regulator